MKLFVFSQACRTELNCSKCRNKEKGRKTRERWNTMYVLPRTNIGSNDPIDFECPLERGAKPWGYVSPYEITGQPAPQRPLDLDRNYIQSKNGIPKPNQKLDDGRKQWGPGLWLMLHTRFRYWVSAVLEAEWLNQFMVMIPCGECRAHWSMLVKEFPPDLSSREAYFAWTVMAHNKVSLRIGNRLYTLARAKQLHKFPA